MSGPDCKEGEKKGRLEREKKTIRFMVALYCGKHHRPEGSLCDECSHLLTYALARIDRCPYGGGKPACSACPIHCYRRREQEEIRRVMRYAGPRMLLWHPVLALLHFLDGVRGRRKG